jgi:RimJ/RimL family protein N-acetyltransferase
MLTIRVLTEDDFPLLLEWLAKPHVKEWWDDGDDTLEKVARHYSRQSSTKQRFILLYHAGPQEAKEQLIGYLQYEINEEGIASIDQFIGAEEMLNQGLGTQAIKLLLTHITTRHQPAIVTVDPAPTNKRAIRCYEKVGFRHYETVRIASGEEAYMMKIEY